MARIRTRGREWLHVHVSGRLTSRDIGRLEHACAPALTTHRPRLVVDLAAVTGLDQTALAVVEQMTRRGVRVIQPPVPLPRVLPAEDRSAD